VIKLDETASIRLARTKEFGLRSPKSAKQIGDWCSEYLGSMLERPAESIARGVKFSRLGVDSAMLVTLVTGLEDLLDAQLDPDVVFEHKTIDELANHLASHHQIKT
jgi:acyl carrier protein